MKKCLDMDTHDSFTYDSLNYLLIKREMFNHMKSICVENNSNLKN